jgi:hypothetical protein
MRKIIQTFILKEKKSKGDLNKKKLRKEAKVFVKRYGEVIKKLSNE